MWKRYIIFVVRKQLCSIPTKQWRFNHRWYRFPYSILPFIIGPLFHIAIQHHWGRLFERGFYLRIYGKKPIRMQHPVVYHGVLWKVYFHDIIFYFLFYGFTDLFQIFLCKTNLWYQSRKIRSQKRRELEKRSCGEAEDCRYSISLPRSNLCGSGPQSRKKRKQIVSRGKTTCINNRVFTDNNTFVAEKATLV